MSTFWHWYITIITIGTIAVTVWFLIWSSRIKVDAAQEDDGSETTGHVWDGDLKELNNPLPRWWMGLFWITIVFSVVYLILYPGLGRFQGVLGWSQESQYEQEMEVARASFEQRYAALGALELEQLASNPEAVEIGRNLYAHNCSTCHGSDARGAVGYPNLTDDHWIWGDQPQQVLTSIVNGRQAAMPGWGAVLGDEGVLETAIFVQQLAGESVDPAMAAAGEEHYNQVCLACHGPQGKGNPILGAPNLTSGVYTYGGDLDTLQYTIRNGRAGVMPAQLDLIGETRSRLVTAYILSLHDE